MFKDLLLVVLVSVVWTRAYGTYLFDHNDNYGLLNAFRLGHYQAPLYQSHLTDAYDDDDHGIVLSHIPSTDFRYAQSPLNAFSEHFSDPHAFRPIQGIHGVSKNADSFIQNQQNKQAYSKTKISQEQIEIKSVRNDYNAKPQSNNQVPYQDPPSKMQVWYESPQSVTKELYKSPQIQSQAHSGSVLSQGPEKSIDYSDNNSQHQTGTKFTQTSQYDTTVQSKVESDNQQDYTSGGFKPMKDQLDNKYNVPNYDVRDGQNGSNFNFDGYHNLGQYNIIPVELSNFPRHQTDDKDYPVIYSQALSQSNGPIRILLTNNHGYSGIHSSLRNGGGFYSLGVSGDNSYTNLPSGGHIVLNHGSPTLDTGNIHESVGDETLYQIENDDSDDLENNLKLDFGGIENYGQPQGTISTDANNTATSKYADNSAINVEQKPIEVGVKSEDYKSNNYDTAGSNYKNDNAPEYSTVKLEKPTLNLEQKSINIGIKSSLDEKSSYKTSEQKSVEVEIKSNSGGYKSTNSLISSTGYDKNDNSYIPTYPSEMAKMPGLSIEQKTVDIGLKSNAGQINSYNTFGGAGVEYQGIGSIDVPKYPSLEDKNYGLNNEQKPVDITIKSSPELPKSYDTSSGYKGIGSIDAPKYPTLNLKNTEKKVEQKSEDTDSYQEVKGSYKSVQKDATSGTYESSKDDSPYKNVQSKSYDNVNKLTYQKPSFVQQKQLSDIQKHPGGFTSTSYRSTGNQPSLNSGNYNRGQNYYGSTVNNANNYISSGRSVPRQTSNSYYTAGPVSINNYQRPRVIAPNINFYRPLSSSPSYVSQSRQNSNYIGTGTRFPYQPSHYRGIGESSTYPKVQNIRTVSSLPQYQDSLSDVNSGERYSSSPDTYTRSYPARIKTNYPQISIKPADSSYPSSYSASTVTAAKPNSYQPAKSNSYLNRPSSTDSTYSRNNGGYKTPSASDYSSDIGGMEYSGIGEVSLKSALPETKPYPISQKPELTETEQKPYSEEDPEMTSSGVKSSSIKLAGEEYSGIGEVGSAPLSKSEIVGGRYPVKRPVKESSIKTKSSPSGVKGKSGTKTEQKYLPITAVLSDSKNDYKPEVEQNKNNKYTKNKEPEKIEQEELSYEGLLGGQGSQDPARASSGFGFRPSGHNSGSYGSDKDENFAPMPYEFEFEVQDDEHGSEQYRQEKMDDSGLLTGSYGYKDAEGIFRQVEYEASKDGFKVNSLKTNEPGTDNQNPADVQLDVQKHR